MIDNAPSPLKFAATKGPTRSAVGAGDAGGSGQAVTAAGAAPDQGASDGFFMRMASLERKYESLLRSGGGASGHKQQLQRQGSHASSVETSIGDGAAQVSSNLDSQFSSAADSVSKSLFSSDSSASSPRQSSAPATGPADIAPASEAPGSPAPVLLRLGGNCTGSAPAVPRLGFAADSPAPAPRFAKSSPYTTCALEPMPSPLPPRPGYARGANSMVIAGDVVPTIAALAMEAEIQQQRVLADHLASELNAARRAAGSTPSVGVSKVPSLGVLSGISSTLPTPCRNSARQSASSAREVSRSQRSACPTDTDSDNVGAELVAPGPLPTSRSSRSNSSISVAVAAPIPILTARSSCSGSSMSASAAAPSARFSHAMDLANSPGGSSAAASWTCSGSVGVLPTPRLVSKTAQGKIPAAISAPAVEAVQALTPEASLLEDWKEVSRLAGDSPDPEEALDVLGARASEQLAAMEDVVNGLMFGMLGNKQLQVETAPEQQVQQQQAQQQVQQQMQQQHQQVQPRQAHQPQDVQQQQDARQQHDAPQQQEEAQQQQEEARQRHEAQQQERRILEAGKGDHQPQGSSSVSEENDAADVSTVASVASATRPSDAEALPNWEALAADAECRAQAAMASEEQARLQLTEAEAACLALQSRMEDWSQALGHAQAAMIEKHPQKSVELDTAGGTSGGGGAINALKALAALVRNLRVENIDLEQRAFCAEQRAQNAEGDLANMTRESEALRSRLRLAEAEGSLEISHSEEVGGGVDQESWHLCSPLRDAPRNKSAARDGPSPAARPPGRRSPSPSESPPCCRRNRCCCCMRQEQRDSKGLVPLALHVEEEKLGVSAEAFDAPSLMGPSSVGFAQPQARNASASPSEATASERCSTQLSPDSAVTGGSGGERKRRLSAHSERSADFGTELSDFTLDDEDGRSSSAAARTQAGHLEERVAHERDELVQEAPIKAARTNIDDKCPLMGQVYVQADQLGLASYHFAMGSSNAACGTGGGTGGTTGRRLSEISASTCSTETECASAAYVSYELAPPSWATDDGKQFPPRKPFSKAKFCADTRTFFGEVDWFPSSVQGARCWSYEMQFDTSFERIISGEIRAFASSEDEKPIAAVAFGKEIFYSRWHGGESVAPSTARTDSPSIVDIEEPRAASTTTEASASQDVPRSPTSLDTSSATNQPPTPPPQPAEQKVQNQQQTVSELPVRFDSPTKPQLCQSDSEKVALMIQEEQEAVRCLVPPMQVTSAYWPPDASGGSSETVADRSSASRTDLRPLPPPPPPPPPPPLSQSQGSGIPSAFAGAEQGVSVYREDQAESECLSSRADGTGGSAPQQRSLPADAAGTSNAVTVRIVSSSPSTSSQFATQSPPFATQNFELSPDRIISSLPSTEQIISIISGIGSPSKHMRNGEQLPTPVSSTSGTCGSTAVISGGGGSTSSRASSPVPVQVTSVGRSTAPASSPGPAYPPPRLNARGDCSAPQSRSRPPSPRIHRQSPNLQQSKVQPQVQVHLPCAAQPLQPGQHHVQPVQSVSSQSPKTMPQLASQASSAASPMWQGAPIQSSAAAIVAGSTVQAASLCHSPRPTCSNFVPSIAVSPSPHERNRGASNRCCSPMVSLSSPISSPMVSVRSRSGSIGPRGCVCGGDVACMGGCVCGGDRPKDSLERALEELQRAKDAAARLGI